MSFGKAPAFLTAALLALGLASTAVAKPPAPPGSDEFHKLVAIGSLLCTEAPAQECVDLGWRFADADGDGQLDLEEVGAVRRGFLDWAAEMQGVLSGREAMTLKLARGLLAVVPLSPLFALYDGDSDGKLSQAELLADVELDERPMAKILADGAATDWDAIQARLGRGAALLRLLRAAH